MKHLTIDQHNKINERFLADAEHTSKIHTFLWEYSDHVIDCDTVFEMSTTDEKFLVLQGGGTDGEFAYAAQITYPEGLSRIIKIDPETWQVVKYGPEIKLDHANDITYNPRIDKLVVVHNAPNYKRISFVDRETLDITETRELDYPIFSISYNQKRDCYIVGRSGTQHFAMTDENFNPIREYTAVHTRYTNQGVTTDDDFIYFVQSGVNCVMKYDFDGNFIEYIPLTDKYFEPEHLYFIKGKLYIGFNTYFDYYAEHGMKIGEATLREHKRETIHKSRHSEITAQMNSVDRNKAKMEEIMMRFSDHRGHVADQFEVEIYGEHRILQGAGSDGKYLYIALVTSIVNGHQNAVIVKIDPKTGKVIKKSEVIETDHSNDVFYNKKTDRIYVVHNSPNNDILTVLDPETLEFIENIKLPLRIYAMDYSYARGRYAVGISGGQDIGILNENFELLHRRAALNTTYTTQGMTCDESYIYYVQHSNHCIMKYDWDGNFVEYIPLDNRFETEPENISIIDGEFYVVFNRWDETGKHIQKPMITKVELKKRSE